MFLLGGAFHDKSCNTFPILHPHLSDFDENWSLGDPRASNTPVTISSLSDKHFLAIEYNVI